uniref:Uncharacterized protein n=1 Tax=Micrurus spixii TaxID=129469 RepID=A0A2D4MW06_9SAUR
MWALIETSHAFVGHKSPFLSHKANLFTQSSVSRRFGSSVRYVPDCEGFYFPTIVLKNNFLMPNGTLPQRAMWSVAVSSCNRVYVFLGVRSVAHNGISKHEWVGGRSDRIWDE